MFPFWKLLLYAGSHADFVLRVCVCVCAGNKNGLLLPNTTTDQGAQGPILKVLSGLRHVH